MSEEGIHARARLMDEAEKMGAALVTSGVSRDRVVSYIFAQLCRIASDEAKAEREACAQEILAYCDLPDWRDMAALLRHSLELTHASTSDVIAATAQEPGIQARAKAAAELIEARETDGKCPHSPGAYHMSDCVDCLTEAFVALASDEARRERERYVLKGHKCEPLAKMIMEEGRDWWLGRLTEPIEGFPQEAWCLHLTTPLKSVVLGVNYGDLTQLAATIRVACGPIDGRWLNEMSATLGKRGDDMRKHMCSPCRDGNEPKQNQNGYWWHEYSGDDVEPCRATDEERERTWYESRSRSASDPAEPEKARECTDPDCPGESQCGLPKAKPSPEAMSRLKEALAREGEIVEAQPETTLESPNSVPPQLKEFEARGYQRVNRTKEARPEPPMMYCRSCKVCAQHCRCDAPSHVPVGECQRYDDGRLCDKGCFICCQAAAPEARVSPESTEAEEKGDTRPPDPELLKALKASLRSARDSE